VATTVTSVGGGCGALGGGSAVGLRRAQPIVFADLGWAGDRRAFSASPQHLRSAGAGVALLRGLFRLDAARSIDAGGSWRVNFYDVARF